MTDSMAQVVAITEGENGVMDMGEVTFCDMHEEQIRQALIVRGFAEDLELTTEERLARMEVGEVDTFLYAKHHLVIQSLHIFGGERVMQCDGCPVCTFEGVIEQICDEVSVRLTRKN